MRKYETVANKPKFQNNNSTKKHDCHDYISRQEGLKFVSKRNMIANIKLQLNFNASLLIDDFFHENIPVWIFREKIVHMSKNQPGTVEKNSSTIGPPAGIEPTP